MRRTQDQRLVWDRRYDYLLCSSSARNIKCVEFRIIAVAILAIIKSKQSKFPPSTVIIEQFRPPIGKFLVGASFVGVLSRCVPRLPVIFRSRNQKCQQVNDAFVLPFFRLPV